MKLTYGSYLKLEELLSLQQLQSQNKEHDEMLFIIMHQVYELWFKQLLHEGLKLSGLLDAGETAKALKTINRMLAILKHLVCQMDILETMTPQEFLSFRGALQSASGFQSLQFRMLEFFMGYKRRKVMAAFKGAEEDLAKLEKIYQAPSLWDSLIFLFNRCGYKVPVTFLKRDVTEAVTSNPELQKILIDVYEDDLFCELCERFLDFDEGLQEWRYRHIKIVERTLGLQMGTGGSTGAEYLKSTLFRPFFPDLWAIRNCM